MTKNEDYYGYTRSEVAKFVPDNIKSILDVGCGMGDFLLYIKKQTGAETWGIELVDQMAEKALDRVDHVYSGKVEDVLDKLDNAIFDCITFNDVLEHLLKPKEILELIKAKLSKNGLIIASIPNVRFFDNLFELIVKKDWCYKDAGILDHTHLRFFTKKSAIRIFEDAGYKVTEVNGINKKNSWKFDLFNLLTLGTFSDTQYRQFVFMAIAK